MSASYQGHHRGRGRREREREGQTGDMAYSEPYAIRRVALLMAVWLPAKCSRLTECLLNGARQLVLALALAAGLWEDETHNLPETETETGCGLSVS